MYTRNLGVGSGPAPTPHRVGRQDLVIPGHTDFFRARRMASFNLPSEQRSLLFNFHGRHPGLNDLYKKNFVRGNIMRVFDGLDGVSVGGFTDDYFERGGLVFPEFTDSTSMYGVVTYKDTG
eukprot:g9673.t1